MKKLFALTFLSLMAAPACAVDGIFIEDGLGNASVVSAPSMVRMYRVGALWKWDKSWLSDRDWQITGSWEASLASWHGEKPGVEDRNITEIGITPVFRYAPKAGSGITPYLEGGFLGLHLISPTSIYPGRNFSTAFQFGNALGFGITLGEHRQFDLGYRFQHLSNANIKKPNNGEDFNQLHLAYRF